MCGLKVGDMLGVIERRLEVALERFRSSSRPAVLRQALG
jgi:hypothetical protein